MKKLDFFDNYYYLSSFDGMTYVRFSLLKPDTLNFHFYDIFHFKVEWNNFREIASQIRLKIKPNLIPILLIPGQ